MNVLKFDRIEDRHLGRALSLQARQQPDATYIMFGDTHYTFAEADRKVNELAAGLAGLGLSKGDRVAFFMGSSPEVIFLALATNKLGAIWSPVNSDYKGAWLTETINRTRAHIVVTDDAHVQRLADVHGELSAGHYVILGESTALPGAHAFNSLYIEGASEPDMSGQTYGDTCAVLWTSGTTGRSKGVMQSHNVWFNAVASGDALFGTRPGDVIYTVLPMYNSAAWVTSILRSLIVGIPLAIDTSFSVTHFWDRVDYYGATQSFTLGAMHMFLWNAPLREDDAKHSLRKLMAVPMPADVAGPFSERFDVELLPQGLGQSEAMQLVIVTPDETSLPPGSCGTPAKALEARLVDDQGNDVADGEPGELWVRPREPYVIFNGYFDDPEATAASYSGEWYKTGDMLKRRPDGYYFFSDRKKDAVRLKGRNISTFEVEMVARRHPALADCAAFGVPSDILASETELKLNYILKAGQTLAPEELAQFINENAPYFFVPRYLEQVEQLPYTPTNKVQKFKLREAGITSATWDAQQAGFKAQR
ncbi:AMP-binding protein [Haliea sp.]|jgi:crotonobetaine/carnitine-CoA ligase|uniref:AMP-binding protein n=1 Tax=Haliea TaxID=475794 RepID=UPI00257FFB5B|nr:AMP-binding protein [Haliea sp.]|tara:strand:+ start:6635 stop:8239 length:1605 start_codon:yes stop_codon:yes gene_type:complete